MNKMIQSPAILSNAKQKLRVGFVPLTDCAPLVMAQELGLFKKFGLRVELSREIMDKARAPIERMLQISSQALANAG